MKKQKISNLDLDLYSETLDNGLRIFIVPFKNKKNIYATLSTKYGSVEREFIPIDGKDYVKVPDGVAHFLEHKMFEQEKGKTPFEFYSERGADANANTTYYKTTYLFAGPKCFNENLNYLLDYVYSPYFTDENVEKEKGIIIEEMRMYEDDPYSVITEQMIYNMFHEHPIKIPIIGDFNSINSITKEDLYTCYNTFYHPSNMFLTVTGDVDPSEVIKIVKDNMGKRKFTKKKKITIKKYDEPNTVAIKNTVKKMNIEIPKLGIGYKIDMDKYKLSYRELANYIGIFFDIKLDDTSLFNEKLKDSKLITDSLYITNLNASNYLAVSILGESKKYQKVINEVLETMKDRKVSKSDFERKKKAMIASAIGASDNIYAINNMIMSNVIKEDKVLLDTIEFIKSLDYNVFKKIITKLDLSNYLTYIIK